MFRIALALALSTCIAAPLAAASVEDLAISSSVRGSGPTIIFVHGWTCDETAWDDQVSHFSQEYRVVTLDLPGHGMSAQPDKADFSMDLFAAAVEAVRAEIGAGKVVLVGHSMGGAVIRQYAVNYPENVAGLVAVDGPLDMRTMAGLGFGELTLEQRADFVDSMFVEGTSEELRAEIRGVMLSAPEDTAHGAMAAMFDPANQTDDVISAPALSVFAGQTGFSAEESQREVLTDWQHTSVPGTGHFLMMEKPDEFNALLEGFLAERAAF